MTSRKKIFRISSIISIALCAFYIHAVLSSPSSTAAIDLIFVPFIFIFLELLLYPWLWSFFFLNQWRSQAKHSFSFKLALALGIAVGFTSYIIVSLGEGLILQRITAKAYDAQSEQELQEIFDTSLFKRDKFVLGAIAQNRRTSARLLHKIALLNDPELYERKGSFFDLTRERIGYYAVMRLVAMHPNCSAETLVHIASSTSNNLVLEAVAANGRTPNKLLVKLAEKNEAGSIDWSLARNINTPSDILLKLAQSPDEYTRITLARNINAPEAALLYLLEHPHPTGQRFILNAILDNPRLPQTLRAKVLQKTAE